MAGFKQGDMEMSRGNTKLPKEYAIFNLSAASDCPSRKLGLCEVCNSGVKCYAEKAELGYTPQVLPFRRRQEKYWKSVNASQFVETFRKAIARLRKKPTHVRFDESGDFHDQGCVDKMEDIARMLKGDGVDCYTYTARKDLDFSGCKTLVVNGSGFQTTEDDNQFIAVKSLPDGEVHCIGDCRKCNLCTSKRGLKIYNKIH